MDISPVLFYNGNSKQEGEIGVRVKRLHLLIRLGAVLLTLALCLIAVRRCLVQVTLEEQKQVERNLVDVAEQNKAQIQTVIDSRTMLLEAMCKQMSDEEDPDFLIDQFVPLVSIYGVRRIGFADLNGRAYSTDGYYVDVSGQSFFQRSLKGEMVLTDMQTGGYGGSVENTNIHSAPVYWLDTQEIMGVMFITYRTEAQSELLHVSSFGNEGTSCIFQADGGIVAVNDNAMLQPGENIFEKLITASGSNQNNVTGLQNGLGGEGSVLTTFRSGEREYFFYVSEVLRRPGWYLATIVPTDVLSQRTEPILLSVQNMLSVVVVMLLFCGLIYLWTMYQQHQELYRLAYQDPLTGLANYSAFRERMRRGIGVSGAGYVVSADLRGFGTINNTCGVPKGDELLREMGRVLSEDVGRGELAAHVSGDRFVLFLHSESQEDLVRRITALRQKIVDLSPLLEVPHVVPQFGVRAVDDPSHPEQSYSDANLTKQRFRERADSFYSFFDGEMRERNLEIQQMEDNFGTALEQHQFEMWYQPKYDPVTGKLVAAEALVRWRRPDGTLIPPGKFIPLFEHNGMISQLDEYTFEMVCAQQRTWKDEGKAAVPVSVNVSRASLFFADIVARYMVIAKRNDIETDCIELEITESAIEGNGNIEELIRQFRSCGFRILVDDFGSGYSSMSTLTKRYFDNIKIDKSLTDCIGTPEGDSLLGSIVHMAHEFNMTVTAEGVEEKRQVDFLVGLSCDNIQGYYYSRPLPVPDFTPLLVEIRTEKTTA